MTLTTRKGDLMKTKIRLLLAASILAGAALMPVVADASCRRYCWHVDENTSCCQLTTCEIVC
jgi:hypothetical protein